MKLESHYRKELLHLSNKIFELKNERKQIALFNAAAHKELMKSEVDMKIIEETIEQQKKDILEKCKTFEKNRFETKKNMSKYQIEEENKQFYSGYNKHLEWLEKSLKDKRIEIKNRSDYLKKILDGNKVCKILENGKLFKSYKHKFNELNKEQRIYYLDLLKKGFDVRNEGLVWIVRRLLELSTKIEKNMFPRFLDKNQIDYIMKVLLD